MKLRSDFAVPLLALLAGASLARAEPAIENTVVFIECTANGATSRGSGVLVSKQGHVLTAGHVVPAGAQCKGSIGVADPGTAARLVVQPSQLPVDMALLRFSSGARDYDFAPYCMVEDWMVRRRIVVAGFPGNTETGSASYREGVLSTTITNQDGLLETDGQTVEGMSGGPVFSKNLAGFVGIVAGVKQTPLGSVSYFGILPVAPYAQMLGLQPSTAACYHQNREKSFDVNGGWTAIWRAGDENVDLKVPTDQGFCFLETVFGEFNHPEDEVWVLEREGGQELGGNDAGGGSHGASARCIWYE